MSKIRKNKAILLITMNETCLYNRIMHHFAYVS